MESLAEEWLRLDKVTSRLHDSNTHLDAYVEKDLVTRSEIERLVADNNLDELRDRLGNSEQQQSCILYAISA